MQLAFPLGSTLGGVAVTGLHSVRIGPNLWRLSWTANDYPANAAYIIYLNGKRYAVVRERTDALVRPSRLAS